MEKSSLVIYAINAILILSAFVLVYFGKISWQAATVLVGVLLTPSAGHVALAAVQAKK